MFENSKKYYEEILEPEIQKIKHLSVYELNEYLDLFEQKVEVELNTNIDPREILVDLYAVFSKRIFDNLTFNKKIYEVNKVIEPSLLHDVAIPIFKVVEKEDFCKNNKIIIKEDMENVNSFVISLETFISILTQEVSLKVTDILKFELQENKRLPIENIDDNVEFNRLPNRYKS